ncbi:glycoside hydrolase family 15 protein [Streptomyces rhizosphaericus]|uniref:glycoside hydrolase family 15 protein n=1 Tax=Streptomyces rhizosphaericus TaxID=114699 RepID=UPI000A3C1E12|nr:glycoside hydrolase family 15 protein [Streptomyces rhizosphaericus]
MLPTRRIEDFALVSDMQTAALIGSDGTVEWACLPRFDSPAIFANLLGDENNGFWRIGPARDTLPVSTARCYREDTLVLETRWATSSGIVKVFDFMPPREDGAPQLVRIVEGMSGRVPMTSRLRMRMDYGSTVPWVETWGDRTQAVAGPNGLWLDTTAPTYGEDLTTCSDFTITEGERVAFTLTWHPSHLSPPPVPDAEAALKVTEEFWRDWVSQCTYDGPYREAVVRSLITLKALTYAPTGGIVAAPTTSLPEELGGERNWDYRHCWLRDAAIALSSLLRTGYRAEARAWAGWLVRAVAGDPDKLQIMYGIAGERQLPESELDWLGGYEGSRPVRIGNAAAGQLQLDVYGEVAETLHRARQAGLPAGPADHLQIKLIHVLEQHWMEPDDGIWESRGPRRHYVHSKVMAWVAVDRTVHLIESGAVRGPLERWRILRETIHRDVCEHGFDAERNTFTQSYGSKELDAAALLIPQMGFLPPDDPRIIGTIEAIQRELTTPDGFVLRYATAGDEVGIDGLSGDEGAFLACSFWLADDLAMIGRLDEARELFERLLTLRNDLGLLAEEWDSKSRRQVGNFPQAFSHVGLLDTALTLERLTAAVGVAA